RVGGVLGVIPLHAEFNEIGEGYVILVIQVINNLSKVFVKELFQQFQLLFGMVLLQLLYICTYLRIFVITVVVMAVLQKADNLFHIVNRINGILFGLETVVEIGDRYEEPFADSFLLAELTDSQVANPEINVEM